MNQDKVKQILLAIEESQLEFSVVFSGKTSKKVNGLYKPDTHEILLHNKNFTGDNELLYTAIHEYTHHLLCEQDGGIHSSRVHTQRFWSFFHMLLQKAEEKGLYKITLEESPELLELTETIRTTIMTEDGRLMKELGRLLGKARTLCKTAGVRYEDYIDRVLCLPRASATTIEKMHVFDVKPDLGYEAMKVVANIANADKRKAAEDLFLTKHSPAYVRNNVTVKNPEESPRQKLEKEQHRLERTIGCLQERLEKIKDTLAHIPIAACLFSVCVFTQSGAFLCAQEESNTHIPMPSVPDIPPVTLPQQGIKRPVITPPVIQPLPEPKGQAAASPQTARTGQVQQKTTQDIDGLTARALSSLAHSTGNVAFFNDLLREPKTASAYSAETLLTKILTEVEKLQEKNNSVPAASDDSLSERLQSTAQPANEKKAAAKLIRLRINNKELKDEFVYTFCSSIIDSGDFLYGADRKFVANGILLEETVYIFGKIHEDGWYDIAVQLYQHPRNPNSFLQTLYRLSPIRVTKTSDLLFWHYKDSDSEVELIFRLS
ncbi:MAG: hypothetical protein ACTTJ7_02985 [Treponema sp.]